MQAQNAGLKSATKQLICMFLLHQCLLEGTIACMGASVQSHTCVYSSQNNLREGQPKHHDYQSTLAALWHDEFTSKGL